MAQYFSVHPTHPQPRLIARAARIVQEGGVIAYPTDSCYAFGCRTGDKEALARLRRLRGFDESHHLTLMCRDLSEIATYARVDNVRFRLLKALTPGSYTFILEGTRELPRRILHARRKTIGLRVPDHPVAQALLAALNEPLLSATATLKGAEVPTDDAQDIRERLERELDLVLDAGSCGIEPTTVIDLTGAEAVVVRAGKGDLSALGKPT
ncbi:MAG: threonylcarbamoyl-AMP synthase [Betaproteobacteria bacterium RBG_16_64_18]|nr:MAG: threonylcarbamoyl-AMP synthase [Betaproteobacteria bacterium RBG_16_64_18]OGA12315.1 MAG: threonylcarbamoyl-AMP synthase [Betaproteobacteria bacterium RIFCSPLOWO2_02_FULL_65_20]OGA38155.1 MAG: threonylcarbamoyl-AMP synthase [Betaproteobacteria bacterium RIFCSPLOWO2_12_FULL_65_110]